MNPYPIITIKHNIQWEFQDPKMEVLYHIRPYFVGIFLYMVGTSNQSDPEMAIEI